ELPRDANQWPGPRQWIPAKTTKKRRTALGPPVRSCSSRIDLVVVEVAVEQLLATAVGVGQVGDRAVGGIAVQALHAHAGELAGDGGAPLAVAVAPGAGDALARVAVLQVFRVHLHRLAGAQHEGDLAGLVAVVVGADDGDGAALVARVDHADEGLRGGVAGRVDVVDLDHGAVVTQRQQVAAGAGRLDVATDEGGDDRGGGVVDHDGVATVHGGADVRAEAGGGDGHVGAGVLEGHRAGGVVDVARHVLGGAVVVERQEHANRIGVGGGVERREVTGQDRGELVGAQVAERSKAGGDFDFNRTHVHV